MEIKKKLALKGVLMIFVFVSCIQDQSTKGGLLWKISGNGLKEPSYLFGTNHGMRAEFLDSIAGVFEAMNSVKQLAVEFDNNNSKKTLNMYLPADTTYRDLLNDRDLAVLDSILLEYFYVSAEKIRLKPIAIALSFSSRRAKKESLNWAKENPFLAIAPSYKNLDSRLKNMAIERAYQIISLDTEEEMEKLGLQDMRILFNANDLEGRAKEMVKTIIEYGTDTSVLEISKNALQAYYDQDLERIENWDGRHKVLRDKKAKAFHHTVVTQRNIFWKERIVSAIHEQPTFIKIGAGHLPGKKGLINLLIKEGYEVKSVEG